MANKTGRITIIEPFLVDDIRCMFGNPVGSKCIGTWRVPQYVIDRVLEENVYPERAALSAGKRSYTTGDQP
jgi:hypothetical protein